jgi:transcriptional regulator with XRE-family HTH domain
MDAPQEREVVDLFERQAAPEPLWRELVGQVLRSERIELGRTLQQVAQRAGVSPQYLSEIERGRKDSSSEMLESVCGALGLRLADLLAASSRSLSSHTLPTPTRRSATRLDRPSGRPSGVTSMAA